MHLRSRRTRSSASQRAGSASWSAAPEPARLRCSARSCAATRSPRTACCCSRRRARPAFGFSGAPGREASTIAQFLYRLGRYDGARQRAAVSRVTRAHRKEKTVVIDECSMLTMDDLYAVLRALDLGHVERLILVGDPNQLPPIGVGRPFADLIGVLDEPSNDAERAAGGRARTADGRGADGAGRAVRRTAARRVVHERAAAQGRRSRPERPRAGRRRSTTSRSSPGARRRSCDFGSPSSSRAQLGLGLPDDIAGFDKALGLTEEGWVPFDDHDGVERFQLLSPVRMHAHGVHDLNRWFQRRVPTARRPRSRRSATSRSAARTR